MAKLQSIMSLIVWKKFKLPFFMFGNNFQCISTKLFIENTLFYILGCEMTKKLRFLIKKKHIWNWVEVISLEWYSATTITDSQCIFYDVRTWKWFSYKNSCRKKIFLHSFWRNNLFMIFQTISVKISLQFWPKTWKNKIYNLT